MADAPPPSSLVALRDRREAAIQLLADSFAADLLTIDELDDRVARAHAAAAVAELDALVADLMPLAPAKSTALVPLTVDASLTPSKKRLRSIFGNLERHGAWVVPAELGVAAVFGSAVLDFREARFTAPTTDVEVRVVCGNLEIIVPPQLAVECDGSTFFGNLESHGGGSAIADPDRPILRIHGPIIFGNVEIQIRLPGESERDARERRKRERKGIGGSTSTSRGALPGER
jgi:hypothetical protein